eukprot:5688100-Pyramimonas_sp.AAC.1
MVSQNELSNIFESLAKTNPKLSHCLFSSGRPTSFTPRQNSSSSSMPKSSTRCVWTANAKSAPGFARENFSPARIKTTQNGLCRYSAVRE